MLVDFFSLHARSPIYIVHNIAILRLKMRITGLVV